MTTAEHLVAAALAADADAQVAGRLAEIGARQDDVRRQAEALGDLTPRLAVAFEFWDQWADARNHDWRYYERIESDVWPQLARRIALALSSDEQFDSMVLDLFAPRSRKPLGARLVGLSWLVRPRRRR